MKRKLYFLRARTVLALMLFSVPLFFLLSAFVGSSGKVARQFVEDNKRYLAVMLLNEHEEDQLLDVIDAAADQGFNAVYLTARWDAIACHNAACMVDGQVDPNWGEDDYNWTQVDAQIQKARSRGMKIAIRIHLLSADLYPWGTHTPRSHYLWGPDKYMKDNNGSIDMQHWQARMFSFAHQSAIDKAKAFAQKVMTRYGSASDLLFVSFTTGPAQELEYNHKAWIDYSAETISEYNSWYSTVYGSTAPYPPSDMSGDEGKKWYIFRHKKLKEFSDQMTQQIKSQYPNVRVINDHGSVIDALTKQRGTFGFAQLNQYGDGVKVNDHQEYDHRFSMDVLRSNLPAGSWIMNEAFLDDALIASESSTHYYERYIKESFNHGAKLVAFVCSNASQFPNLSWLFSNAGIQWYLNNDMQPITTSGSISYTFSELFSKGFSGNRPDDIYNNWLNQYNGSNPVQVNYNASELDVSTACPTPPSAPTLSASSTTITSGSSTTLYASGCSNGTVLWSNNVTGTEQTVTPTSTTTYTATCTVNGCTSSASSITITVDPQSGGGSCAVNKVKLIHRSPGDAHLNRLVGAKIQGSNDGSSWSDLYTINVDGTGTWQEFTFGNTASYNQVRFVAGPNGYGELYELEFYKDLTKLTGSTFGTGDYTNAFDGNTGTWWHGSTAGSGNYAGVVISNCEQNTLTVSPTDISNVSASGATQAVSVTSNVNWTVSTSASWITVSASSGSNNGSFNVNIASNGTTSTRSGTVTVTDGSLTQTINVSQAAGSTSGSGCVVNKVRFIFRNPNDSHLNRLVGAKIQGSNDGSTWTDLYTINVNGTGYWQEFTFSNTTPYSRARFVAGPNGYGELYELEFYNNSTKLSGSIFGSGGDHEYAFDGNTASWWHGSTAGSGNFAGLIFSACGSSAVLEEEPAANGSEELKVLQNPNRGTFDISFYLERGKPGQITVVDLRGANVYNRRIIGAGQQRERITLSNTASGTFILLLKTDKRTQTKKVIVNR